MIQDWSNVNIFKESDIKQTRYHQLNSSGKKVRSPEDERILMMNLAKMVASEFYELLITDSEFNHLFSVNSLYLPDLKGIIKTLFIKIMDQLISLDPELVKMITSESLNNGIFKKYLNLHEENRYLRDSQDKKTDLFLKNQSLIKENTELKKQVEELTEALLIASVNSKLNSTNSNKPPSMDFFREEPEKKDLTDIKETVTDKKEDPIEEVRIDEPRDKKTSPEKKKESVPNTREKTNRKPGGQPGHKGKTLDLKKIQELIAAGVEVEVLPLGDIQGDNYKSGYLLDLNISPVITEVRVPANQTLPTVLQGGPTYGKTIRSLVPLLSTEALVGYDRIARIIKELSGDLIDISAGVLYEYNNDFFNLALPEYFEIMDKLAKEPVLATDTTSFKVKGKRNHIRNHSSSKYCWYFPTVTKKKDELFLNPLLNSYHGILLHDHETALYGLDCQHAECNIHVIRKLRKMKLLTNHKWIDEYIDLFVFYNQARNKLIEEGRDSFGPSTIADFYKKLEEIFELAREENQTLTGKKIRKKERRLINRLEKYQKENTLFINDFRVDFTNNISERDLRSAVRKRKMIGSFRNFHGLEIYCVSLSLIESYKKQDLPVFGEIKKFYEQFLMF